MFDDLTDLYQQVILDHSKSPRNFRKLEEANYIVCTKSFAGRLPKTEYRLTAAGRRALERYLNHMEALIRATREG